MINFKYFTGVTGQQVCINLGTVTKVVPDSYVGGDIQSVIWFVDGSSVHVDMPFTDLCLLLSKER